MIAPKWMARLAVASTGVLAALGVCEWGMRVLLFGQQPLARRLGAELRDAQRFTHPWDSDHWKLRWLFANSVVRRLPEGFDPVLGWRGDQVGPDYRSVFEPRLQGRTPILFYGDSYARCHTSNGDCFEGLLSRSPLAEDHLLLNFGVGGYGLGQIYLMLRESVDHYADADPIVVVSLLVDNDLDRLPLHFRHWPKPQLGLEDGRLAEVGPALLQPAAYIRANPVGISSYVWRYVLRNSELLPFESTALTEDRDEKLASMRDLAPVILRAMHELLEQQELRHVFLLFLARRGVARPFPESWREELVTRTLEDLGAPFVSVRPEFEAELDLGNRKPGEFFLPGDDHYNPEGNRVAFRAMLRGIRAVSGD